MYNFFINNGSDMYYKVTWYEGNMNRNNENLTSTHYFAKHDNAKSGALKDESGKLKF